jgi:FtsP/CotA-like multicopper oxidase with cupredoxin domain
VWVGNPNSLLINGKGIAPECQDGGVNFNNSLYCLDTCMQDPLQLLSNITVDAGKTYRLRLINSAQLVAVNFAITSHNMFIVQAEGTNIDPIMVQSLDIGPGQRYDVLLNTDKEAGAYWVETTVRERNITDVIGRAILRYAGTSDAPGDPPLHPLWNDTAFGEAQDDSLFTADVSVHPEAVALNNATEVTRYILVGTQNRKFELQVPVKIARFM